MNNLPGEIISFTTHGHLSLVKIKIEEDIFTTIIIDTPATVDYLKPGNKIHLLFKENEVFIAKNFTGNLSIQNRFKSKITAIEEGVLLSKVIMQYKSYIIASVITTNAVKQLQLTAGDEVTALVKTNEITLSTYD